MTAHDGATTRSQGRTRVAAFDFDGTLTTRDSVVPFLWRMLRPAAFGRTPVQIVQLVASMARRDRDRLRAVVTDLVFRNKEYSRVVAAAEVYAWSLEPHLRRDTVERLLQHVADGDEVVIVSASYREYLEPWAQRWEADSVIATQLETIPVDGVLRCTGALVGGNCRGQAKVDRLERWMSDRGLTRDGVELWAYGDSSGDRELLAWADHPQWIRH